MLNVDENLKFERCRRCGERGFERLHTHGHCVSCNHFETATDEGQLEIPDWVKEVIEVAG